MILRNRILGDTKKIVLVTFFQLLAPALTVAGILIKKSGGIMGNAAMQANLNGASPNIVRTKKKNVNEVQYSCEHDILA